MPVTVAVDSQGTSVHQTGPAEWAARIAQSLPGTAVLQYVDPATIEREIYVAAILLHR